MITFLDKNTKLFAIYVTVIFYEVKLHKNYIKFGGDRLYVLCKNHYCKKGKLGSLRGGGGRGEGEGTAADLPYLRKLFYLLMQLTIFKNFDALSCCEQKLYYSKTKFYYLNRKPPRVDYNRKIISIYNQVNACSQNI